MPRRVLRILVSLLVLLAAALLPGPVAVAATGCVPSTGSTGYTVTVCITAPADGAVLSGRTKVSATATVAGGSSTLRVSGVTFCLDAANCGTDTSKYVLKSFGPDPSGAFSFTLDTTLFADRTATLYAYAEMNDGLVSQPASESVTFQNGQTSPSPVPTGFTSKSASAADGLVVAAVGDGADGRSQQQSVASMIAGWSPDLFLYLGDVYEKGSPAEFSNWYAAGYSRFDSISNPTIGNHEYSASATAEGYMRYWKSPPHYYSYDAGGWHFVSLDSTDKFNRSVSGVQQTLPGTGGVRTMYDWLVDDLAAHQSACTIVYYHEPLWNQGEESPNPRVKTIWSLLAQQHVSLVLNGHDHDYQRFPAVDGSGSPSATGVTEIISGGGGHGTQAVTPGKNPGPNPVVYGSVFGALKLTLHPDRADFTTSVLSGTTTKQFDSGSVPCQSAGPDTVPPTKPVLATPQTSSTSTGPAVTLSWTAATDDRGVAGYRVKRDGTVVSGDLPASTLTWTDTTVEPSTQYDYTVEAFDSFGNATASDPQSVTTPGSGQVVIQAPGSATQDTYASAASPAAKGSATTIRVSAPASTSGENISYLKFDVKGTSGIGKATLMLNATSTSSTATATVYGVPDSTWSESTLTWTQRPAIGAAAAVPATPGITAGQWKSWDVTDLVAGNGLVSFALQQTGTSTTAMSFASKENATAGVAPKLVIDPPTSGTAPSAPSGLTATAQDQHTVKLAWQRSTSGSVDHYVVYRDGAALGSAPPLSAPAYTDATAAAGTSYSYTVAAVDAGGNSSAQSASAQVTTPAEDTTGPTVTSISPDDAATGVTVTTNVTATFSEALAPATLTGQTFSLKDAEGTVVPATVTYDGTSSTATLDPDADLTQGVSYTATITGGTGGVTDAAGNVMAADRTWNFSTLAAPTPAASFTASPTSGTAPLSVQFTDTSTGTPTSWSWDFGDGTTATTQNPAHTYSDAGSYTVSFTATNASGSSPAVTGTVTVAAPPPAPVASFTADQTSGTAPLPVQFTDASTGSPTSWAWNFGDGATATTQNPAHTYTAPGTYTVTLTATNGTGASAPITATIRVTGIKAGSSTTANGANAAVSVPRPAGIVNGDVLIVQVTTEQNPSMSVTPSGWTAIPSTPVTIDAGSRMFAFYHVVTNATAEPASYNWQLSAKLKWGAGMTAFSGANTATPLETAVTTKVNPTATTALTVPGVTTTGSGAMLVGAVGLNAPGITVKSSTGWTVSADNAGTQRAVLAYRYLANPGASGDLTWALSKSATSGGWLVALHAAA